MSQNNIVLVTNPNSPLIRVQGSGKVSVSPDTVIIELRLRIEDPVYATATKEAERKLGLLRSAFPRVGLAVEALKTESFQIATANDYIAGLQVFRAFTVDHFLSLRLPFDTKSLGRVLSALAASKTQANLSLAFTVADPEAVKRRVLEDAVRNARSRAEIIASAAGLQLGCIHCIDYGRSEILIRSEDHIISEACAEPFNMNLNPADIDAEDTVHMAWELMRTE